MKAHLLYVMIGVLVAGNVALLLKKTPFPPSVPRRGEEPGLHDRVVSLDTLALRRWSDNAPVCPDFRRPTFIFFFSKTSCATCVDKVVDFLISRAAPAVETYIVSVDVYDPVERAAYEARFRHALPFYALESVRRSPEFDIGLPVLMVVNSEKEILYVRQILPSDDLGGDYLFWKRMNFLYSLLAL